MYVYGADNSLSSHECVSLRQTKQVGLRKYLACLCGYLSVISLGASGEFHRPLTLTLTVTLTTTCV